MKPITLVCVVLTSLLFAGCGGGIEKTELDTSELRNAFATSEVSGEINSAADMFEQDNFEGGMSALVDAAKKAPMDGPMLDAMWNTITMIQRIMAENPEKDNTAAWDHSRDLAAILESKE